MDKVKYKIADSTIKKGDALYIAVCNISFWVKVLHAATLSSNNGMVILIKETTAKYKLIDNAVIR